ncbi:MAG: hypothetical protein ACR2HV_09860, partial [Acidimicrobiales bacterium]
MPRDFTYRAWALVGGIVAAGLLPMSPANAQTAPPPSQPTGPAKADADRNKLFDDLESELAGRPGDEG